MYQDDDADEVAEPYSPKGMNRWSDSPKTLGSSVDSSSEMLGKDTFDEYALDWRAQEARMYVLAVESEPEVEAEGEGDGNNAPAAPANADEMLNLDEDDSESDSGDDSPVDYGVLDEI
jgi:hypothetical protein